MVRPQPAAQRVAAPAGAEIWFTPFEAQGQRGDKAFSRQLIRVWIGKTPPNAELKDGLVGGKK